MHGPARPLDSGMTLQVEVELRRVCDIPIDNGTGRTISRLIALVWTDREEPDVMTFADHKNRDLGQWVYTKLRARICSSPLERVETRFE